MYFKKIFFDNINIELLHFCIIYKTKYFFATKNLQNLKYLLIPNEIKIEKTKNSLIFYLKDNLKFNLLISYVKTFLIFLKKLKKEYVKKISLKGLGFRLSLVNEHNINFLRLKLGFSHLINVVLPIKKVLVVLKKRGLIIKSENKVFLGNFCHKLKMLKYPNSYNGKGFWYKGENFVTKFFKKK